MTLDYLIARLEFWDQLEIGKDCAPILGTLGGKASQSFRLLDATPGMRNSMTLHINQMEKLQLNIE